MLLSKFTRLLVYSYLPTSEILQKIATLCKQERLNLKDSAIANRNRELSVSALKLETLSQAIKQDHYICHVVETFILKLNFTAELVVRMATEDMEYEGKMLYSLKHALLEIENSERLGIELNADLFRAC